MKHTWITAILGAILIGSGCGEKTPDIKLSPNKYAVSVMILELPKKAREQLKNDLSEANVNQIASRKSAHASRIPTLYLNEGQTKEYDNRTSHSFLIVPPANNAPGRYGSVTDGEYLKVTLTLMPSGEVCLGLIVTAPKLVDWKEVRGPGNHPLKQPVLSFLNANTAVSPPWGHWRIAHEGRDRVVLVRADLPIMPL